MEPILVGIGMFTGGTIWLLTHGHFDPNCDPEARPTKLFDTKPGAPHPPRSRRDAWRARAFSWQQGHFQKRRASSLGTAVSRAPHIWRQTQSMTSREHCKSSPWTRENVEIADHLDVLVLPGWVGVGCVDQQNSKKPSPGNSPES